MNDMKRAGYGLLFFLCGIFFVILIWVGLALAVKERVRQRILERRPARPIGDILASAGIGVTFGDRSLATAMFMRRPMPEIWELLQRAEL